MTRTFKSLVCSSRSRLRRILTGVACLIAVLAITSAPLRASTIEIQFTGLNLTYDGNSIFDSGVHNTVGNGNPADADPLTSMNFYVDGSLVGVLNSNVFADLYVANVGAMPTTGGFLTSAGNGNTFGIDLLTSNSNPGWGLALDIDSMQFLYTGSKIAISISGVATGISAQSLPFGLAFDPSQQVTIVLSSANLTSITSAGGFITHMNAAGTGNVAGIAVPEPSSIVLMSIGLALAAVQIRRRKRA